MQHIQADADGHFDRQLMPTVNVSVCFVKEKIRLVFFRETKKFKPVCIFYEHLVVTELTNIACRSVNAVFYLPISVHNTNKMCISYSMRTLQGTDVCICAPILQYGVVCRKVDERQIEVCLRRLAGRSVLHHLLLSRPLCLCAMLLWLCLLSVACNQLLFLSLWRGLSFVPARAAKHQRELPRRTHTETAKNTIY